MDVSGRTIIVTGGSRGIGRGIAKQLGANGADVVIADVSRNPCGTETPTDRYIEEQGGEARFIQTDVTDEDSVRHLVYTAAKTYDGVSGLVNNAGVHHSKPIHEESEEAWQSLFDVNVDGYYRCMKHVLDHFIREDTSGDIVNIGSIAGLVGFGESPAYCASKGAIVELTREVAVDYGDQGINVNAVDPGVVKTSLTEDMRDDPEQREFLSSNTVAPRFGEPEDIANAVQFLLSNKSDFVMGENLVVDGGWTAR